MKARMRAQESGKPVKRIRDGDRGTFKKNQSRKEEMLELFESDMSEGKRRKSDSATKLRKKSKSSFNSKSRYFNLKPQFFKFYFI